jgi:hypothetical protein
MVKHIEILTERVQNLETVAASNKMKLTIIEDLLRHFAQSETDPKSANAVIANAHIKLQRCPAIWMLAFCIGA